MARSDGFQVDTDALVGAHAEVGRPLRDLDEFVERDQGHPSSVFGHDELAAATEEFHDRWRDGVSVLSKDVESLHRRLADTIATYRRVDEDAAAAIRKASERG